MATTTTIDEHRALREMLRVTGPVAILRNGPLRQAVLALLTDRDEWTDQTEHPHRKRAVGLHVPAKNRPTLVHHTREDAEREAARLACESKTGWADTYAVFELVAVVKGKVLTETDMVRGMGTCQALVPKWDDEPGVEV